MSFNRIRLALVTLLLVALAACGGGGGEAGTTTAVGGAGTPVLGTGSSSTGGGTTTASPTVTVGVSSAVVTASSAATVTVTVRDASGNPVSGKVVDLKTVRGNLATLNLSSVVTDANGSASARLSAAAAGLSGADEVVAVAILGTTTVQGSTAFSVQGSVPTLSLNISAATLRVSTGSATLRATLKDAAGNVVANQAVAFSTNGGLVNLSTPSVLTDGFGTASVTVSAASASGLGTTSILAAATVGTSSVQSAVLVQVLADTPSMTITPTSSTVSAAAPATLRVLLRDTNGAPVAAGTVVSLSSAFGLSAFDATTAATDAFGVASVVVTPKTNTSNGADQIVASATVGGVALTGALVVQVSASSTTAPPVLRTELSSTSISAASPASVTATLTDGRGQTVAGQVVTFSVVRGLAKSNVATALTDRNGQAVVVLIPTSSSVAGADEVVASASFGGSDLKSSKGFQVQATNVTLTAFTTAVPSLSAYGQTTMTVAISGAGPGSPVNVAVTSSCVSQGKATLSPASFTATSGTVDLQFKDNGCGALLTEDKLQASIVGTSSTVALSQAIQMPTAASIAFVTAAPEVVYIKASGFTETSTLTFEVRDGASNQLPNRSVRLSLLTRSGGVTMEGGTADVTQISDANGRVTVRVNAGTQPTAIRVSAALTDSPAIATVSSNLSVAVGLPSQLNFSLSQQTINIEAMDVDGVENRYTVIASDRNGNPVPNGTSINFIAESGQIEPIVRTTGSPIGASVSASAIAGFQSSSPRPADGRFTVTAYALGEESFIDQNGDNIYNDGEPFQDLGNLHKDRLFDGAYDPVVDEYIPTNISNSSVCVAPADSAPPFNGSKGVTAVTSALLALDASIPTMGGSTCDGKWSGAGKVYVRRAIETVMSTSRSRLLWAGSSGLDSACSKLTLQDGRLPTATSSYTQVSGGEVWYGSGAGSLFLNFIVADANTFPTPGPNNSVGRLNPMAAGTTVTASTPTTGIKLTIGGSPVPNTSEASRATVGVTFETASSGVVFVTVTSKGGLATTYPVVVQQNSVGKAGNCPL